MTATERRTAVVTAREVAGEKSVYILRPDRGPTVRTVETVGHGHILEVHAAEVLVAA